MNLSKEAWTTTIEVELEKDRSEQSLKIGMTPQVGVFALVPTKDRETGKELPIGVWALPKVQEEMEREFVPELFLPPKLVQLLFLSKTANPLTNKFELRGEEFTLIRDDVHAKEEKQEKQHRLVVAIGKTHHLVCSSCRTVMVAGLFWNDASAFLEYLGLSDFQPKDKASKVDPDLVRHAIVNENTRKLMDVVLDLEFRGL